MLVGHCPAFPTKHSTLSPRAAPLKTGERVGCTLSPSLLGLRIRVWLLSPTRVRSCSACWENASGFWFPCVFPQVNHAPRLPAVLCRVARSRFLVWLSFGWVSCVFRSLFAFAFPFSVSLGWGRSLPWHCKLPLLVIHWRLPFRAIPSAS